MTRALALSLLLGCAPRRPESVAVPDLDALEARILWGRERVAWWCGVGAVHGFASCRRRDNR